MSVPTRPSTSSRRVRRRRSAVAAALALTAGLAGCLAPAALADPAVEVPALSSAVSSALGGPAVDAFALTGPARSVDVTGTGGSDPAPSTRAGAPAPSSAAAGPASGEVTDGPALTVTTRVRFDVAPYGAVGLGTPITVAYTFMNTGTVPLNEVGPDRVRLDVQESRTAFVTGRVVTADDLRSGVVTLSSSWTVRTPTGSYTTPTSIDSIPLPGALDYGPTSATARSSTPGGAAAIGRAEWSGPIHLSR
ncbi:hypothetical protein EDF54_1457 [Rathayibacter sp. PhB93]|uniref:hypothetical protein n=1 Tax=unclassified Rathayibacter TaxID=2609250 RepID=UPI000FA34B0E|nr:MULTISPECIES: hypothetical protein [unclassified Rathayibacter]ROQ06498.1 hypothetical protein EDF54_1457 [Rathayibacter sp. PhB93]TDQ14255.1 hypothetical protein EDF17_1276 [Rathayibacter sp. PhB1]